MHLMTEYTGATRFLSYFLLLQTCSALSTPGALSEATNSNRIFIGGLSNQCTDETLRDSFAKYGTVTDISIIGLRDQEMRRRKPYAFVTFDSNQSASDAISNHSNDQGLDHVIDNPFQQVKRADPIDKSKRKKSYLSRKKEQDRRDDITRICKNTNLILMVQSTHVNRLEDYINFIKSEHDDLIFNVEGVNKAVSKNMSLFFMSVSNPSELARRLSIDSILHRTVKKHYVVDKGVTDINFKQDSECMALVQDAFEKISGSIGMNGDASFRIHAFPPSNESRIVSAFEQINADNNNPGDVITLNPKSFTDIFSVVQVHTYSGRERELINNGLVMTGISPSFVSGEADARTNVDENSINRAYYKLQEAVDRYKREYGDFDSSLFHEAIAIDCGSSPGGWSKFLADDMNCKIVHSIDPGDLVIDRENINHMKMKIQEAIPILKQNKTKAKIFVSDMCLHAMEAQLDFLLLAKNENILEDDAFFVLTLKCSAGFTKNSFDWQVEKALEKLVSKANTKMLSTYHLFYNRNGERTIVGFIL